MDILIKTMKDKAIQVEQDFLQRYPRNGNGRNPSSARRDYTPWWMRNGHQKDFLKTLRKKGIYVYSYTHTQYF